MLGDILENRIFPGDQIVKILIKQRQRKCNDFVSIPVQ